MRKNTINDVFTFGILLEKKKEKKTIAHMFDFGMFTEGGCLWGSEKKVNWLLDVYRRGGLVRKRKRNGRQSLTHLSAVHKKRRKMWNVIDCIFDFQEEQRKKT